MQNFNVHEVRMSKYSKSLLSILMITFAVFGQDPEVLLNKGQALMEVGDLAEAESLFNQALQIDPSFAPAQVGLSKCWLHRGDLDKAYEYSIKAVQMDEELLSWSNDLIDVRNRIQNGKRNIQQGLYEEALKDYNAILIKYPYYSGAAYSMGVTKFRQKDIESAASYFKQALDIYPDHQKARKGLDNVTKQFLNNGNKAYKRGDLEKATALYKKALKYDSGFYHSYYQLGVLEKKLGNSDMAISYLSKVLEIKPDHDKSWFTLGTVYETNNDLDSAIVKYQKTIDLNPGYTKAYGRLGNIYINKKDYASAEYLLKTATQIDPTYANGYIFLGNVYVEQELFSDASEQFSQATIYDENNFDAWFRLATSLNQQSEWKEASNAAQKCVDLKNKFAGGWYELGIAEMGLGNKIRAKKYFEIAHKDRNWRKVSERKIDEINNPIKYEK